MNEAPNFSGIYPNAGKLVGPAWRRVWVVLADHRWHSLVDLEDLPDLQVKPGTIRSLTREAQRAGVLEVRRVDGGAEYRRPDEFVLPEQQRTCTTCSTVPPWLKS